MTNEQRIWTYFKDLGLTNAGTAGLVGNLYAESLLNPQNLQNSYEKPLGYDDQSYTDAVDNGDYDKFSTDAAGYGLAQWTYKTRKAGLFALSKLQDKSIGDLELQLCYIKKEMEKSYKTLWELLKTTDSIDEATVEVMVKYEGPADQSTSAKNKRIKYATDIYNRNTVNVETDEDGVELTDAPEVAPDVNEEDCGCCGTEKKVTDEPKEEPKEAADTTAPAEDKQPDIKNNNTYVEYIATEVSLGIWGTDWETSLINKIKEEINKKTIVVVPNKEDEEPKVYEYYKVVSGDTLTKIANKYNTTVEKIIEDNIDTYPTITKNYIKVGWILKV